ncbi:MAG: hypothetical protein GX051_10035 [Clostridiales bacterium]|nr:hypothetical protein [Clostridiales bacterium]
MGKGKTNKLNRPLTVLETATYSLGSLGREFSNNCVNAFFLVYLCIYQGLNPVPMTIAFVLAKVWDAVNDPMLATLVNNSKKSRFGRYRPWMFGGAVVNAISLVLMFTSLPAATGEIAKYAYYIFMYVIWGMSFTVMDVPFWSMLPTIANSTEERNKASSMAKLVGGFGGFLVGMVGTSVIFPNFSDRGMSKAYMILGVVAGLIMITFILFTVIGNREKYAVPHENVGLKHIIDMFKQNDQLRAYALHLVFFLTGTTIALSQILYIYVYCYEDGANLVRSEYSYTLFWVIACTGQGIAMFFYNQITKKIPREKIYAFTFVGCIISYVLMFFIFFFLKPGNYVINAIAIALSGAFLMLASGMNQIGSTVMIADVVDYGEFKTGKRGDSVIFSVQTLISKFAGALAMLILGMGISAAQLPTVSELPITDANGAYVKSVNVFTDSSGKYLINNEEVWALVSENPDLASKSEFVNENLISSESLTVLRAFMFLIPIPMCLAGYAIYKKKYWLYGTKYDDIKSEIDRRRRENGFDEFGNAVEKENV